MSCGLASKILTQNCDLTQTGLIRNRSNVRRLRQTMATVKAEISFAITTAVIFPDDTYFMETVYTNGGGLSFWRVVRKEFY